MKTKKVKGKTLSNYNPFLVEQTLFESRVITNVSSSTAVETGEQVTAVKEKLNRHHSKKRFAVELA